MNTLFMMGLAVSAITIHEFFHVFTASLFNDDTGKRNGRFSLDPLKHIDLVWTIVLPFLLVVLPFFSYSSTNSLPVFAAGRQKQYNIKQVRFKVFNYKIPTRFLEALIAFSGPMANLSAAFLSLIALAYFGPFFSGFLRPFIAVNMYLFIFNLFPIPPLDGLKLLTLFFSKKFAARYEIFAAKLFWPFLFFLIFYGNSVLDHIVKKTIQLFWFYINSYLFGACLLF